jgi:hypothetical protein
MSIEKLETMSDAELAQVDDATMNAWFDDLFARWDLPDGSPNPNFKMSEAEYRVVMGVCRAETAKGKGDAL